jgi:hypothetical protein
MDRIAAQLDFGINGFEVWDAAKGEYFHLRFKLFGVLADLPAKGQLLNMVTSFSKAYSWCCICTSSRPTEMSAAMLTREAAPLRTQTATIARSAEVTAATTQQQRDALKRQCGINGMARILVPQSYKISNWIFLFFFCFFFFGRVGPSAVAAHPLFRFDALLFEWQHTLASGPAFAFASAIFASDKKQERRRVLPEKVRPTVDGLLRLYPFDRTDPKIHYTARLGKSFVLQASLK